MDNNKNIIFIAGGGTGGHLFPALTIGKKLSDNGLKVKYIGSKFGIESNFFNNNSDIELLDIKGLQRSIKIQSLITNFSFPYKFIKSYLKSRRLIKKLKPKLIIGTGGYSSGLPLLAGIHLGIPTIIQDQNSIPGLITKKLVNKVNKIFVAYQTAIEYLDNHNVILTGNPIRESLVKTHKEIAKSNLGLNVNKKLIFILGGSQGSLALNNHIFQNLKFYKKNNYKIILQCGKKNYHKIPNFVKKDSNIIIKQFINDISSIYSASDLIISRAGALAISELTYMGKAIILIPFKYAADNHQQLNAEYIKSKKACVVIDEDELRNGTLEKTIYDIVQKDKIIDLENHSIKASYPNATEDIIKEINKILKNADIIKN